MLAGATLASLPPGAALASGLESIDPAEVSDFDPVAVIAACERLSSWAVARQLAAMEISARLRLSPSTAEHRVVVAGMASMVALLPADGMATLRAVLDAAAAGVKADHPDDPRTVDQRRVDALVQLAQASLAPVGTSFGARWPGYGEHR